MNLNFGVPLLKIFELFCGRRGDGKPEVKSRPMPGKEVYIVREVLDFYNLMTVIH